MSDELNNNCHCGGNYTSYEAVLCGKCHKIMPEMKPLCLADLREILEELVRGNLRVDQAIIDINKIMVSREEYEKIAKGLAHYITEIKALREELGRGHEDAKRVKSVEVKP